MWLQSRKAAPPLDEFVNQFWLFEGTAQPHGKERALPDGCAQLIVNLREDQHRVYDRRNFDRCESTNGCLLVGPQTEFNVIDSPGRMSLAGIHFKPGGAYPFFGAPADELLGVQMPLDLLWGRLASELRERLLESATPDEQFRVMEQTLLARVTLPLGHHPAVTFALRQFQTGPYRKTVAAVTEQTGFCGRHFIEVFRREVGMTPKLFCRLRRFQQALESISSGRRIEWTEVALEAGYFDQAHFIHDFRAFSGINPSTYREARPQHRNHVPLQEQRSISYNRSRSLLPKIEA